MSNVKPYWWECVSKTGNDKKFRTESDHDSSEILEHFGCYECELNCSGPRGPYKVVQD